MKVLDVDLFQDGLQRNITMLGRLSNEIEIIQRAVEGLVQMEDQLKGEGGNAIRSFYGECHLPFLQFFQLFSGHYQQVLHQMEVALHSLEPDSSGYILEPFLEGEVERGLTQIGQLTASLTDEANSIMDQVSDIVGLPHLDDSGVQEGIINSKRKRDDTISQLYEFDATQTNALHAIEQDLNTMETWLSDLEGIFEYGLTDIHFQTENWRALTSKNNLKTDLVYRTSSISGLSSISDIESQMTTMLPALLAGAGPIQFGYGGFINKPNPFVGTDMIALSCPRPENDGAVTENNGAVTENKNQNPFVKSFISFKGIAQDFWAGIDIRREKSLDSKYDFINYATFGVTDGILSGAKERSDKMFESKTAFANYVTFGFSGMVKEALAPKESFSKEHWLNSFGLVGSIFGVGKFVTSPVKKSGNAPLDGKAFDEVKVVTESTSKSDDVFSNYEHNMIENPGPLAELGNNPAANFASGKYNVATLAEDTVFYRAGTNDNPYGQWFTEAAPDSVVQVRIDSAVKPQWINPKTGVLEATSPLEAVYKIKIPEGTTVYTGPVGYQGGMYLGGQNNIQTFVQKPWDIDDLEILNKLPLK